MAAAGGDGGPRIDPPECADPRSGVTMLHAGSGGETRSDAAGGYMWELSRAHVLWRNNDDMNTTLLNIPFFPNLILLIHFIQTKTEVDTQYNLSLFRSFRDLKN